MPAVLTVDPVSRSVCHQSPPPRVRSKHFAGLMLNDPIRSGGIVTWRRFRCVAPLNGTFEYDHRHLVPRASDLPVVVSLLSGRCRNSPREETPQPLDPRHAGGDIAGVMRNVRLSTRCTAHKDCFDKNGVRARGPEQYSSANSTPFPLRIADFTRKELGQLSGAWPPNDPPRFWLGKCPVSMRFFDNVLFTVVICTGPVECGRLG
jgi:hypothetical protein